MSELVKGLRYFHICAMGDCKNPGLYSTKYGECYCKKCVVKYINENKGISDFWPHGVEEVVEVYNAAVAAEETRRKEAELEGMWNKIDKDAKKPILKKSRKK